VVEQNDTDRAGGRVEAPRRKFRFSNTADTDIRVSRNTACAVQPSRHAFNGLWASSVGLGDGSSDDDPGQNLHKLASDEVRWLMIFPPLRRRCELQAEIAKTTVQRDENKRQARYPLNTSMSMRPVE
jgi:hypothetical protein